MTDGPEQVTHVIEFEPELTEHQEKAMAMALELSYLNGRLEECGDIIRALSSIAEEFAAESLENERDEAETAAFLDVISMLQGGLNSRGQEVFDLIKELDVDAS